MTGFLTIVGGVVVGLIFLVALVLLLSKLVAWDGSDFEEGLFKAFAILVLIIALIIGALS